MLIWTREGKEMSSDRSQSKLAVEYGETAERKEKAMIARFDHRPMLTALLALATTVLVVVVTPLSTLLITSTPAASPSSIGGSNPGAGAANPAGRMDAGGKGYGMPVAEPAQTGNGADSAVDSHAQVVARYHEGSLR